MFPNIIDRTEGTMAKVIAKAKELGLWKGTKCSLFRKLVYLATYANRRGCSHDRKKPLGGTRCVLYRDWAPLSFSFRIERRDLNGEWVHWFNGGLIYSGPDVPLDGSMPSLTVSLTPYTGWGVHT